MPRRRGILFVTDGLGNGGKERQLMEILSNLDSEIYSKHIITFNPGQHYTDTAKKNCDTFQFIDKSKSKIDPFFYAFEIIEKIRPDIIHVFDLLSVIYTYLPSLIYKIPVVNASIQDTYADVGFQRALKNHFLRKNRFIIANSRTGLDSYGVEGEVLYNMINPERFKPRKETGEFSIVMVANFTKYKDYDAFLKLSEKLLLNGIVDRAYAAGDGELFSDCKGIVKNFDSDVRNRIIFTGSVNNIEEFLSDKNIGILFSTERYGEGISNSVLEYMAAGLVPVVSDIGASSEFIVNGRNGYLVDKNDTDSVCAIIKELRGNKTLFSEISRNAGKTVNEIFNVRSNMEILGKCYDRAINSKQ